MQANESEHEHDASIEPIEILNAEVVDAFVNFNLRYSNPGELQVIIDEAIDLEAFYPVTEEPVEAGYEWITEADGLFVGFRDGKVQPPADEPANTYRHSVAFADGTERDLVKLYTHMTNRRVNDRWPNRALSVQYKDGYLTTWITDVELAWAIIQAYVNGPLGSEPVSYWAAKHDNHFDIKTGSGSLRWFDDKYDGYVDTDVVLVEHDIYTWEVKSVDDVDPETDTVYGSGQALVGD